MGERAGSPWVGEPGRLSLEDSERFSDDSERLVCSRFDCFVILRKRELRFLLVDKEGAIYPRLRLQNSRLLPQRPLGLPIPLAPPSAATTHLLGWEEVHMTQFCLAPHSNLHSGLVQAKSTNQNRTLLAPPTSPSSSYL